jgi:hypothetical protein
MLRVLPGDEQRMGQGAAGLDVYLAYEFVII